MFSGIWLVKKFYISYYISSSFIYTRSKNDFIRVVNLSTPPAYYIFNVNGPLNEIALFVFHFDVIYHITSQFVTI